MSFDELQALIPQYLAGELTPAEKDAFEEQLGNNASLRIELEEMRSLWNGLGLVGQGQPSAALRTRFYQRLNAISGNRGGTAPAARWRGWRIGVPQLAAALSFFVLGLLVGRIDSARSSSGPEIAQLHGQVEGLRQTVALSLLDGDSATSRLEGISWSNQVQRPDNELVLALLTTLNHDRNVNVRLASLDALEKLAGDTAVRKALEESIPMQESPLVQIALVDALVHLRDNAAIDELRKLSSDDAANASVRQRAQWGLQKLNFQ
jgi:HEAT repeats/Putative zinc-finger